MSIFRRKKSSAGLGSSTASLTSNSTSPPLPPKRRESVNTLAGANPSDSPRVYVDDFGRPVGGDRVAFGQEQAGSSFGNGYGIGDDDVPTELRLLYGYTPIETTLELSISRVAEIVARSAHELGTRGALACPTRPLCLRARPPELTVLCVAGLDTPLILSSMSLDLSLEGTVSLIRSYLVDQATWAYGASCGPFRPLRRAYLTRLHHRRLATRCTVVGGLVHEVGVGSIDQVSSCAFSHSLARRQLTLDLVALQRSGRPRLCQLGSVQRLQTCGKG